MVGYERIPSTRLRGESTQGGLNPLMQHKARVRRVLGGLGYDEMMTFSFVSLKSIAALGGSISATTMYGCFTGHGSESISRRPILSQMKPFCRRCAWRPCPAWMCGS